MPGASERLAFNLARAATIVHTEARFVVYRGGLDGVGYARADVPVRTGHLKSTIGVRFDADGMGFDLEAEADYAEYVEFGTTRMSPQPYLGPAMDRVIDEVSEKLATLGMASFG